MWTPSPSRFSKIKYIGPLRDNLETLIKENEADALKWANDGTEMPVTKLWQKAIAYSTLNPFMAIVCRKTQKRGAGDEGIPQTHVIEIFIQDEAANPDAAATVIEKRVLAVDMIITSANPNVLKLGWDSERISVRDLWVMSHSYSDVTLNEKSYYAQAASLFVNIETLEG